MSKKCFSIGSFVIVGWGVGEDAWNAWKIGHCKQLLIENFWYKLKSLIILKNSDLNGKTDL